MTTGFKTHKVPGDGTCMFRSLFAAFHQPQPVTERETVQGVRWLKTEVQKYICHHRAAFQHFFGYGAGRGTASAAANSVSIADYCKRNSPLFDRNFYGGHPELVAAANVLRAVIAVHHSSGRAYDTTIYPTTQPVKEIHLKYSGRNHYDWLEKTQRSMLLTRIFRKAVDEDGSMFGAARGSRTRRGRPRATSAPSKATRAKAATATQAKTRSATRAKTRSVTQAENITRAYLSTVGLPKSLLPNARAQLGVTPFGNDHRQFLKNHGYDHAAGHADALVLAHMVRAQHEHRAFEKLMTAAMSPRKTSARKSARKPFTPARKRAGAGAARAR